MEYTTISLLMMTTCFYSPVQSKRNVFSQVHYDPLEASNICTGSGFFFSKKATNTSRSADQCGFRNFFIPDVGDFPWLATILVSHQDQMHFACNGNLISNRHVLTEALCFNKIKEQTVIKYFVINIGGRDVQNPGGSHQYRIKSVDTNVKANLVVLTLTEEVQFKTFIRPICLSIDDITDLQGVRGVVVAVNILKDEVTKSLQKIVLREVVTSQGECQASRYLQKTKPLTFCTEFNDVNSCGDAFGSGFMIKRKGRWTLRGVASLGSSDNKGVLEVGNSTQGAANVNISRIADQCGIRTNFTENEGDYPWSSLIVARQIYSYDFSCNGNLVSTRHILTVAHCLQPHKENGTIDKLRVIIGKHDVDRWISRYYNDGGVQNYTAETIDIHPDYNSATADADMAVLTLAQHVHFGSYVLPICLWRDGTNLGDVKGAAGVVTGWTTFAAGVVSRTTREVNLKIVDLEDCLRYGRGFAGVTSERTFCAGPGPKKKSYTCSGNIGSGFMMERNGIWTLRGVMAKRLEDIHYVCDSSRYMVFTDVSKFSNWILEITNK